MGEQVKFAEKCRENEAKTTRERPLFVPNCATLECAPFAHVIFNEMLICSVRPKVLVEEEKDETEKEWLYFN